MSLYTWTSLTSSLRAGFAAYTVSSSISASARPVKITGPSKRKFYYGINVQAELRTKFEPVAASMKVFAVSDVHTDHDANMDWLRELPSSQYSEDTLICAGDVTDNLEIFKTTMTLFKKKFRNVFFVPGNHDVWCRRKEDNVDDSLAKLVALSNVCNSLGVLTTAAKIDGVWIIPLFSWYHESWDKERDIEGYHIPPVQKACTDFSACKWPAPLDNLTDSVAQYFDELNASNLKTVPDLHDTDCQVITFSHFLPRFELCPEKRMLLYPNLPKMVGSDWLEARVRSIHGQNGNPKACHIFGHTHFSWDATLDGIRYIQAPLAYPRERERRGERTVRQLPLCIYNPDNGGLIGPLASKWSDYYSTHERDPNNQQLAPWVEGHYQPLTNAVDS